MHQLSRAGAAGGGLLMMGAASAMAQQPAPGIPSGPLPTTGTAATVWAVVGGLSVLASLMERFWDNRKLKVQLRDAHDQIRELKGQVGRNAEGLSGLSHQADVARRRADVAEEKAVAAHTAAAATDSKIDALHTRLISAGFLRPASGRSSRPHPTLLLVEDDPDTARLVADLFTEWGWAVTPAASVGDALDAIDRGFHWIMLDLKLVTPGDGLAVLRAIRERQIASRVAVVTGAGDPAILAECRELGPDVLLPKPVDVEALRKAVRADLPPRAVGPEREGDR